MRREASVVGAHLAGNRQVGRPAHVRAVQPDLVDRLAGSAVAQFRGAVGGQHHQGQPVVERLGHRREIVGGGAARCADQGHALLLGLGQADGEEAARPLVQLDPAAQPRHGMGGQDQRCRAGSRGADHVAHAPVGQLPRRTLRSRRMRSLPAGAPERCVVGHRRDGVELGGGLAQFRPRGPTPPPRRSPRTATSRCFPNPAGPTGAPCRIRRFPPGRSSPPGLRTSRVRPARGGGGIPGPRRPAGPPLRESGAAHRRVRRWCRESWRSGRARACRGAECRAGRAPAARPGGDPAGLPPRSCRGAGVRRRCRARAAPCCWSAWSAPAGRPERDRRRGGTIRPGRRPRRRRRRYGSATRAWHPGGSGPRNSRRMWLRSGIWRRVSATVRPWPRRPVNRRGGRSPGGPARPFPTHPTGSAPAPPRSWPGSRRRRRHRSIR